MIELDLSGLKCPLPVLRTRKALKRMAAGEQLRVTATDQLAAIDLPHLCTSEGHVLVSQEKRGEAWVFVIGKGADVAEADPKEPLSQLGEGQG
jgi:tRNA 2-thiouridine synthesizing protein A